MQVENQFLLTKNIQSRLVIQLRLYNTFIQKNKKMIKAVTVIITLLASLTIYAQKPVNWTPNQLIEPSVLADEITSGKDVPLIISVGPGAIIPNSYNSHMASTPEGMSALTTKLDSLSKDTKIVIYCGCCPFEHCPNVRPAIDALKAKGFTNYYLLNLSTNIKTDWISKGYPVKE